MKKVVVLWCLLAIAGAVHGDYTMRVNGLDVTEYTMDVGSTVTITVLSDSLVPVATDPTDTSQWNRNGVKINAWDMPNWSMNWGAFTSITVHYENIGWSGNGWTNGAPYQGIVNMGFALEDNGPTLNTGVWWETTYQAVGEGDVNLGLGYYHLGSWDFNWLDNVLIHQQIPEPVSMLLLGLGGLGLLRRR